MSTFETLLAILFFTLRQGLQAAVWIGLGGLTGLLLGAAALLLLAWCLRRWSWSQEHPGARVFTLTVCCLMTPPLLALAGTLVGAGQATANLIAEDALLQEVGDLALDGAASALESARESAGDLQEEVELGLRLVRGEETFPISNLEELLKSFSAQALETALEAYDKQAGLIVEAEPGVPAPLAQSASLRFLLYLHDRSQQFGEAWLAPVTADLEERDVAQSGEATGREMALSITRVHVQRPIARFTFLSFLIGGASLAALGLAPLLLVPFGVWVLLVLFGSKSRAAPGGGDAESDTPGRAGGL